MSGIATQAGMFRAGAGGGAGFLLDTYGGAEAAYSLQVLSSSFEASDLVTVRRSGDNAESGFTAAEIIGGSLVSWVVAGGGSEDGHMKTWVDQSGNGYDQSQATTTRQPKIVSGGSLILNDKGNAGIQGDGVDDFISTGGVTLSDSGDISYSKFEIFEPMAYGNNLAVNALYSGSYAADRRTITSAPDSSSIVSERFYGGFTTYNYSETGAFIWSRFYGGGGGSPDSYADAVSLSVAGFSNAGLNIQSDSAFTSFLGGATDYNLGGSSGQDYSTSISTESIWYLSDQSSNRAGIETEMNGRYGIY